MFPVAFIMNEKSHEALTTVIRSTLDDPRQSAAYTDEQLKILKRFVDMLDRALNSTKQ